jgi:hypothetical protein
VASAADFMPANTFSTQTPHAAITARTDARNTISHQSPAASTISGDLRETRNIPPTLDQTEVPILKALSLTPEQARSAEAGRIFQYFWGYVQQHLDDTTPVPSTTPGRQPPWLNDFSKHLRQTADTLVARGINLAEVKCRFQALLADVRSGKLRACIARGGVRDALPFAIGSFAASLLATGAEQVAKAVGAVTSLIWRIPICVASGIVIMLGNTAGAALLETLFPSLRDKLPQTTPAPGLEHLNASIHNLSRECAVSFFSFAGLYGMVRNPLRLLFECLISNDIMSGGARHMVHAALEVPLAIVGAPLRACLDHLRMSENNAATEILLQDNLADLLTNDPAADASEVSRFAAFRARFSKSFFSLPTASLCGLLIAAFAWIEWGSDVTDRANTNIWERILLNLLDFFWVYGIIGVLLQIIASSARNLAISTADQRRETERHTPTANVERGAIAVTRGSPKQPRISVISRDSGILGSQGDLQNMAWQHGGEPWQFPSHRASFSADSVFGSPSSTPPETPPHQRPTDAAPFAPANRMGHKRRVSVSKKQHLGPLPEAVTAVSDSLPDDGQPLPDRRQHH